MAKSKKQAEAADTQATDTQDEETVEAERVEWLSPEAFERFRSDKKINWVALHKAFGDRRDQVAAGEAEQVSLDEYNAFRAQWIEENGQEPTYLFDREARRLWDTWSSNYLTEDEVREGLGKSADVMADELRQLTEQKLGIELDGEPGPCVACGNEFQPTKRPARDRSGKVKTRTTTVDGIAHETPIMIGNYRAVPMGSEGTLEKVLMCPACRKQLVKQAQQSEKRVDTRTFTSTEVDSFIERQERRDQHEQVTRDRLSALIEGKPVERRVREVMKAVRSGR